MRIEKGSKDRYNEILDLVRAFHKEALSDYILTIDLNTLIQFFDKCLKESFLLIDEDTNKCEGLIAGQEIINPVSGERFFQETIWYVNEAFRKHGVYLFNQVQEVLKQEGFTAMVMVCMANSKTDKLVRLYEKLGFVEMERHWLRRLN